MAQRILITGASIAGNAAAWWLAEAGYQVTLVERAPAFRDGGQNVDVRGLGRTVLRRMGLEAEALARGTGELGTAWIDGAGRVAARVMLDPAKGDGPTAEMEILRGDLALLLHEAARGRVETRYGDSVAAVDAEDGRVTFASGITERYDAVVVAEGVGSATRELVLPNANSPRWMNLTIAYLTIPRTAADDRLWRWYNAPGRRSVSLRPDTHGTARAMLMVQKPPDGEDDRDVAGQKDYLRDTFADAGWETPRILDGMEGAADFYFEELRQVRLPRWSRGRVVLLGDAAWCLTPLGGQGATLAILGAYTLAGAIARAGDVGRGFAGYEAVMRPIATRAQAIPKFVPRLMHPRTRLGIGLLHGALGIGTSPAVRAVAARLTRHRREPPRLPEYGIAGRLTGPCADQAAFSSSSMPPSA